MSNLSWLLAFVLPAAFLDFFKGQPDDLDNPPRNAVSVTKSDTNDLAYTSRGVYIGTTGNLAVIMDGGQSVVFKNLAAGMMHPMRVTRVLSTGTTAVDILAVW